MLEHTSSTWLRGGLRRGSVAVDSMSASSRSDPSLDLVGRPAEVERLDAVLDPLHHGGEGLILRGERAWESQGF